MSPPFPPRKRATSPRRYWRAEEALAVARQHLRTYPDASGSEIARLLGVSEAQGKSYRRRALQHL